MTSQQARAEVQRLADAMDALPPDTPPQTRRELLHEYELAIQEYHYWSSIEKRKVLQNA